MPHKNTEKITNVIIILSMLLRVSHIYIERERKKEREKVKS